ncbi:MAG: MBOAT family protein [Flavobacteriia bacterium]|nr:MBOAT family protein [Flavobacteriia bacterium]
MLFNSLEYCLLISSVVAVNLIIPKNFSVLFLIFTSAFFIGYHHIESLLLVLFSAIFTFYVGYKIQNSIHNRRLILNSAVFILISSVVILKVLESKTMYFQMENTLIALGISFYSIQNIAYLIDSYHNRLQVTVSFQEYLFSILFFPKFLAGPITNVDDLVHQISSQNNRNYADLTLGFQRMFFGFTKKLVLADRIAPYIHYNLEVAPSTTGLTNLTIAFLFTIQLYIDFSAYTDIAIGSAKMLGFNLKENFNLPLRSKSISEFWRKWHISLTNWLTKYIFYPVSFKFRSTQKKGLVLAILLTFLISGLWHGFGFTFIIYALSHAFYIIFETLFKSQLIKIKTFIPLKIHTLFSFVITFSLVSLSFIFFRESSLQNAWRQIKSIFSWEHFLPQNWLMEYYGKIYIGGESEAAFNFKITLGIALIFLFFENNLNQKLNQKQFRPYLMACFVFLILFLGIFNSKEQFIYIQF